MGEIGCLGFVLAEKGVLRLDGGPCSLGVEVSSLWKKVIRMLAEERMCVGGSQKPPFFVHCWA